VRNNPTVTAAHDGVLTKHVQGNGTTGYGYYARVTNGTFRTTYGHASPNGITAPEGQISAGTALGDWSQGSGSQTAPHLHYSTEVYANGRWNQVDPQVAESLIAQGMDPTSPEFAQAAMQQTAAQEGKSASACGTPTTSPVTEDPNTPRETPPTDMPETPEVPDSPTVPPGTGPDVSEQVIPRIGCTDCTCHSTATASTINHISAEHMVTWDLIYSEFLALEDLLLNSFFKQRLLPAMMHMTEQMAATAMEQVFIIGAYFDAANTLEVQRLQQKLTAEAHRDYQPSMAMCVFGTNVRSLSEAERTAEVNSFVLNQRSMDRQLGNKGGPAPDGAYQDVDTRIAAFKTRYCDIKDNNGGFRKLCNEASAPAATQNKDIDFGRALGRSLSLDLNFTDTSASDDEQNVLALANNLYGSTLMARLPEGMFNKGQNPQAALDVRALVAKRSVLENSFNTFVGLRSAGSEQSKTDTYPYMKNVLKALGLTEDDEIKQYLGASERPSYYAQMEILTKKLYQSPTFFANLYDKPVNVDRQGAAMQAIGLMQDFDTWQSYLRTEASLSILLELEIINMQQDVQRQIDDL